VRLHEVENSLLEVVKHAYMHCMEEVGLREVTHDTGNMSKHVASSVNMAQQAFGIGCLGVGMAERSSIGCDPAGGVACQERHNLQLHSLHPRTKNRHAA
jgi:hypothetical protein